MQRYHKGLAGEIFALLILLAKGYWPLAWRWRGRMGELDLIVKRGSTLVGVEVKYRTDLATAHGAISAHQQQRLQRALVEFAQSRRLSSATLRLDAFLIGRYGRYNHYPSAFY